MATVASQQELLALHSYVLDAMHAVSDAEKRLLTALGQATTVADNERADDARELLSGQVTMLREALAQLSDWLDGPAGGAPR
jgi:hypothetical protein